ncbi:MAG: Tol-Pal system beta propeller repeat protein TolB [Coxiellaceae bacterium]|jgi:TolB protein|nr:Tol-Pal system beta propeller repeat protein TolB [Coxiellaceae bacterium]
MHYRLIKLLVIGWLFFASSVVLAALKLELTRGADNALPVAVLGFVGEESIGENNKITPIISNDLRNSGRFRLVDTTNSSDVNIETKDDIMALRACKIEGVVTGQIQSIGKGNFSISFKLLDVYNKGQIFTRKYPCVKKEQLRQLAHHISDVIYQKLTGDKGIFSTKIAYILVERHEQNRSVGYKLQVVDSDGANVSTLLSSNFPLMSPSWSPDGKKIAYVSFEGNRAAIYVQEIATGKRDVVAKFPGINGAPAWSPDGNNLACVLTLTGYPKIYILNLIDKKFYRLTDGSCSDTEPSWALDGKSLIFTSNRGGSPQIYRFVINNKKIERLTFNGPYNVSASFLPNSNSIVILHQEGEMFSIACEDLESGRIMVLTSSGLNESPSLAPNGKMIVYATGNTGRSILAEVSIDGRIKSLLPAGDGAIQEPAWSPFLN